MSKMIGVAWFTSMLTAAGVPLAMGLIVTMDEQGNKKAFLGAGTGESLEEDVQNIINWGSPVNNVQAAVDLVESNGGVIKEQDLDWTDVQNNKESSKTPREDGGCEHAWMFMTGRALFDGEIRYIESMYCLKCYACRPVEKDDQIMTPRDLGRKYGIDLDGCEHNWVDGNNEVVSGAEVCTKCKTIRAKK